MSRITKIIRRYKGDCRGNAAVEFAMLIPVFLLLIIGIYEFGKLYWIQNTLQYAAEQTARCIMANSSGSQVSISSGNCAYSNYLPMSTTGVTTPTTFNGNTVNNVATCGSFGKCQNVTLLYDVSSSSTDSMLTLVYNLMSLAARHSRTTPPSIKLVGQATVPIS